MTAAVHALPRPSAALRKAIRLREKCRALVTRTQRRPTAAAWDRLRAAMHAADAAHLALSPDDADAYRRWNLATLDDETRAMIGKPPVALAKVLPLRPAK